ncbi:MAG TPA: bifunctional diaminohydroxyphosphoribosylaminopyrimidine deaminase/5-amino-6-(5-phosphoribosylamino)uracil reductase RibD [Gemmatimonadales bacterium]|jgi:diaminohydroxyphosphoribosylaminopyrimidine deaminase/5-amino-6-(5-phosphoribosylamino)uracil reductase|nr:bifunctional diaminohydroxyphosphoribosylaminopyrimidine deaminase/5-amino-6-(5-phosphoribosylamino)uracil reductase RibD [Gemmatimonadales bacterium]
MTEEEAMQRALELARRGWGRVAPNPMVGAVVLRDGQPVGEGYHAEYGGPHAEAVALDKAGGLARGGTLVVTLEPCAHEGKQPACTGAVAASGVARVVAAVEDPNPVARGGAAALNARGIPVALGLCRDEASVLNAPFIHQYRNATRPFIALKLATSVDGKIADRMGKSRWVSGPEARDYVQWLRMGFDAIAVGGSTARRDNPALTVRGALQPRTVPRRVVLTRSGNLEGAEQLLGNNEGGSVMVGLVSGEAAPAVSRRVGADNVIQADSLEGVLAGFRRAGIGSMLIEGGGDLAGSLLSRHLVDRFYWVQSPLWLGAGAAAFGDLPGTDLEAAERWRPVERRGLGADTLLVLDRA